MSRSFTHLRRRLLGAAVLTLGLGSMHLLAEPALARAPACTPGDPQDEQRCDWLCKPWSGRCELGTYRCVCDYVPPPQPL